MQIIKEYIIVCSIIFQVFYETGEIPTYYLYKMVSVWFMDANIVSDIEVDTTDAVSSVT